MVWNPCAPSLYPSASCSYNAYVGLHHHDGPPEDHNVLFAVHDREPRREAYLPFETFKILASSSFIESNNVTISIEYLI